MPKGKLIVTTMPRSPMHAPEMSPDEEAASYAELERWFTYHPPREGQPQRYELLRAQGLVLARLIQGLTPAGSDRAAAIRKVREAIMTANAAIACEGEAHGAYYISNPHLEGDEGPK